MSRRQRQRPRGVEPLELWLKWVGRPTLRQFQQRHGAVLAAVCRYRAAGLAPRPEWLEELGVAPERPARRKRRWFHWLNLLRGW